MLGNSSELVTIIAALAVPGFLAIVTLLSLSLWQRRQERDSESGG